MPAKHIFPALALVAATFSSAVAATATQQSCQIGDALLSGGKVKVSELIVDLFSWTDKISPQTLVGAVGVLETLDVTEFGLFAGIDVGDFHQTQILVVGLRENSPLFIELRYQKVRAELRLTNINFKDQLTKLYPNIPPNASFRKLECA